MTHFHHFIILTISVIITFSAKAITNDSSLPHGPYTPFDINYNYSLTGEDNHWDCSGTLSFSLTIPTGLSHIILERTPPHYTRDDIRFTIKREISFDANDEILNVFIEDVKWGTYFRIAFLMDDGVYNFSSVYNINSYISQTDLDKLTRSSGIEDVKCFPEPITYDIESQALLSLHPIHCEIFDFSGKCLFNGVIDGCLPMANTHTQIIILRYYSNNYTIVKKIKL